MKKIPLDTVLQYWRKHQAQTPDDMFCSLRKLYAKQHAMIGYLMKAEGDSFNEAEHQTMYYVGSFIVYVMMQEFPAIPAVPEDLMLEARKLNVSLLGYLGSEERPEDVLISMNDIIDAHPQSDLLRFILEILMRDPEVQRSVREQKVWYLFAHLKIVIDAMGKATPPTN